MSRRDSSGVAADSLGVVAGKEREFYINGLRLSALEWGEAGQPPVIALHGWLDNAASFNFLAPALAGLNIIALDMAGHGRSDHRPGAGAYSLWDDMQDVIALADALGWTQFSLLGHSRGAIISAYLAGCFPDRISRLLLIDGVSSEPVAAAEAPAQMAQAIRSLLTLRNKSHRIYPDTAAAIQARMNGMFPLSFGAARELTLRGIVQTDAGVSWASDMRLLAPTPFKFTQEHVVVFLQQIRAPALLILADAGLLLRYPDLMTYMAQFPKITVTQLSGGHHLHLEAEHPQVAAVAQNFFAPLTDAAVTN